MTVAALDRLASLDAETYDSARLSEIAACCDRIRDLKREKNAILLAHNYQRPEIFEVADFVGDSLELAREAAKVEADVIVFAGVHFMAETAKILNPSRKVILPNLRAGCSLADSVDLGALEERIRTLRAQHSNLGVVCYVNTNAATKALCHATVTSANAIRVVEALPFDPILFLPDKNLAAYVAENTRKKILVWEGDCYVHEQITPEEILRAKAARPGAKVLVHPECRTDVLHLADAILSTSGMIRYAKENPATEFLVVTECGLSDRLAIEVPEKRFYKACKLCRYMKMITLENIEAALLAGEPEITVPENIRVRAEKAIQTMLAVS